MIHNRTRGTQRMVLLAQCLLITASFWLWFLVCNHLPITAELFRRYLIYNEFVILGLLMGSSAASVGLGFAGPSLEASGQTALRQLRVTLFYLLIYLVAAQDSAISRLFFFTFIPVLYLVLLTTNHFLPSVFGRLSFGKSMVWKVVLMGPRAKAVKVKQWLVQNGFAGLEILGLLSDDPASENGEANDLKMLGPTENLAQFLAEPGTTEVIMAEFPRSNGAVHKLASLCEERGARLLVVADLDQIFGYPLAVYKENGLFYLGLREEPLEDPINRLFKRCLDIFVSLPVVLFILPPLFLVVRICQRIQSPGPLFFMQPRQGFHNRPFNMFKLRTMHVGDPGNDKLPTSKSDPRLYPVGAFLRKSSLDEMPQFLNVLLGDMSVVGPRPHLRSYNEQYKQVFDRAYIRSFVKPGVTGLAQVRGFRGNAVKAEDVVHRMESDIEYLENWSLRLDFWLITRTATQMFLPPKTAI